MPTQITDVPPGERALPRKAMAFRLEHRLIKRQVVALLRDGAQLGRTEFVIKLNENDFGQGRLAIAVPKRILKRAVDRNQVKRVIRETFRQHQVRAAPVDMLVTMHRQVTTLPIRRGVQKHQRHQLRATLEKLFVDISRRFGALA